MQETLVSSLLLLLPLLLLSVRCTTTLAQSPAPSPAPPPKHPHATASPLPGPTDTIKVLLKAGHFTAFVRLIKATNVDTQLLSQLNSSSDGITIFAPNDVAFSNFKSGSLSSLTDREKAQFVDFHVLPRFLSTTDFQTLSNPVKTLAGSVDRFPLTITTTDNSVNISTGVTKASISKTVYIDKQVAIYEIDKVLIPKDLFPAAQAPAPAKVIVQSPVVPKDASSAMSVVVEYNVVVFGVGVVAAIAMFCL